MLVCWLTVVLVVAVTARPSAEISSRDSRGQTIMDGSDPLETPRKVEMSEVYKGGEVPVAVMYETPEVVGAIRPSRDVEPKEEDKKEAKNDSLTFEDKVTEDSHEEEEEDTTRSGIKNSKLLDIGARENDENAKHGLEIQSRNKAPADEETEHIEKPFVYNIQPLSFYSSETKEEENILNYINKIKEMRENQIKFEAEKKKQNVNSLEKHEEAVVTDADTEEDDDRPIRRKIQHFQTLIKPMMMDTQVSQATGQSGYPVFPASTSGIYQQSLYPQPSQQGPYSHMFPFSMYEPNPYSHPHQQSFSPGNHQNPQFSSSVIYLPNIFRKQQSTKVTTKSGSTRIFDEYFPVVVNNPFNEIWTAMTNIVEYGPSADVCKKSKKGREAEDESTTELDLSSQRIGLGGTKGEWPRFTRLKVRRGGVAIAGPGGIATAGSGGTAIVGPGGTAYTTREGTAVVGPGGRVVHVPQFPIYAKNVDEEVTPRDFVPPPGSKTVAEGPIIYYDNPLDSEDLPDPSLPL